jgi:hypothetical protein
VDRVVRRRAFVCLGLVLAVGFWMLMMGVMIEGPHGINGVADLAFGAFVMTLLITFLWALGWHSAIRFTPTRVSVTNFLVTTSVAWADVTAVTIGYGLAIQLRDDSALKSVQFGGSLIGQFTKYPSYRPAASILRGALKLAGQEETTRTGPVQIARSVSWRAPLLVATAIYASLLLALSPHF